MRTVMFAAALLAAGPALAGEATYTDPKGRFFFTYPSEWPIEAPQKIGTGAEIVLIGAADVDCSWVSLERSDLAGISLDNVYKTADQEISPEVFLSAFTGLTQAKGATEAKVEKRELNGWPVHLARLTPSPQPVVAALFFRPGLEMRGVCRSYDGKNRDAAFEKLLLSFGSPKDAEWALARQAPPPPPAPSEPAPSAPPAKQKPKRN